MKKIISAILSISLIASLCCTAAFAADSHYIDGNSIKWQQTGHVVNDEDPANPENPADPANPNNPADPANPNNPADPANPNNPADPANPNNPADPANPENPADPNPADPALNGAVVIGGVNVYMSNLPEVGMKIEDASQGIFACDGAVIVDSVAWLKKNPEYVHVEETISDNGSSSTEGGAYNVSKYIPVTEDVFGKDTYAVDIVLRAVKDVAIFADGVIATVNGMQASAVDMKGTDTCIVTFEFWELSDAVYLNIETVEPMVDAIASNMAYIANFNSNYYIDRNMVEWYRYVPEDENLENGEIATGTKFDFNYRYAIEFYIGVLSDDNAAEDERLHILINGREAEYELAKDKSMIKVFYVYDAYDMVNVDGDQVKSGETKAPAYKIMDGVVMGDLSGDKKVEMTDVVELQKIIAKLVNITNSADRLAADTNGDGRITMEDVTTMQKFIAKLIEKL